MVVSPIRAVNSLVASNSEVLDAWAKAIQGPLGSAVHGGGPVVLALKDLLHGVWLGHPLHPALTDVPLGAWTAGVMFDLLGVEDAADASFAVGSLAAVPTVLAGTADWLEITDAPRRVGFVHAVLNVAALGLVLLSLRARASGSRGQGIGLSLLGYSLAALSGWLGGELVYVLGSGVSRTAFEPASSDFVPATDVASLQEGVLARGRIEVDGQTVTLALLKRGSEVLAISGTCSHAGGPLPEGKLVDNDCVECPWHHSRFSLRDGRVRRGPATVPQPAYETRVRDGKVEVRRIA